jgi:hypothetical protein
MEASTVKKLALQDPTISPDERQALELLFKDDKFFDKLMQGAMGASVAYAVSKFLKLSRTSQIILTTAGFGLGRLIASSMRKQKQNDTTNITIPL